MQLVARQGSTLAATVLASQPAILIICAQVHSKQRSSGASARQHSKLQDCTASKAMAMPRYRGLQLLLCACTGAALLAPTPPPRKVALKAASEGAEIPYELCCQALHDDESARLAAGPDDILKARYSAYVERKPDFIIDTTHPSNEEYDDDREAWRARILDFAAAAKFLQLVIYDSIPIDEETHSITWNARNQSVRRKSTSSTKDWWRRRILWSGRCSCKEDGRWLYLKGDPDFEPRNVRVDGPLDPKPKPPKRRSTAKKPAVSRSRAPVSR